MEDTAENDTTQEPDVNYMPGMPALSSGPGSVKRIFQILTARRGRLRPVHSDDEQVVTTSSDT